MLVKDAVETETVVPGFCDRCGARAMQIATKEDSLLLFCGHHARMYEPALGTQGFSITNIVV